MNRPACKIFIRALILSAASVLATPLFAQGFASISSAPPPASAPQIAPPPGGATLASATPPATTAPLTSPAAAPGKPFELADKVLVRKGERRLYLLKQDRVIAEYPVKLGLNPYGHKRSEGDFRTPEGKYTLVKRNPNSDFFLSIQVSYPNREDAAVAKEAGNAPGGLIMIHGQPNVPKRPQEFYATRDWTDGCIALSNPDMVDVWLRTTVGLPIEIRP